MTQLLAFEELFARFQWASDERAFDDLREIFTPEATSTTQVAGAEPFPVRQGVDAIIDGLRVIKENQSDQRRHFMSNFVVLEESEDLALVRAYVSVFASENGTCRLVATGWYLDRVARNDGNWRIAEHRLFLDAPF